jgi:kynurenine formamidase
MPDLPTYRDLPVAEGAPAGSAWGLWDSDDQLGTLNLLTPERTVAAAGLVRKGAVFPLNLPVNEPEPPLYGRGAVRQTVVGEGGNGRDDYLDNFWPQASSQWDSLRHIRHPEDGWYNGVRDAEIVAGGGKLGIENIARRGIAGRGVLLDIERCLVSSGRPLNYASSTLITVDDLEACREAQGVEVREGDILLVHTGWLRWYREQTTPAVREALSDRAQLEAPGLGPAFEMAEYLWNLHIAAIAADNPALEAWPPNPATGGFMHWKLIPHFGMPIGELWWLADLADDCAADSISEFFFTSAPLNVPGGVGSPPNALSIK